MTASVPAVQRIRGYCGLCIARCGTIATVENGRFIAARPRPGAPDRCCDLRQGSRRAGTRLTPGPADAAVAAAAAEGRSRSGLGGDLLGRGARRDRRRDARHRGAVRAAGRRLQPILAVDHGDCGFERLRAPADERVRHAEHGLAARSVRLGTRLCHPLRVRHRQRRHRQRRRRHGGYFPRRMPDPVGLQSLHLATDPCHRDGRGAQARHEADRGRSPPCRPRQQGGCLAARASGDRRRAGARSRQPDDPARMVRQGVHPRMEQWSPAGAQRHRAAAARKRPDPGDIRAPVSGLGSAGQSAGRLRSRDGPL